MDLKVFYEQIRQVEAEIREPEVLVVSLKTQDGGQAGRMTEVTRAQAAKLIVEGRVRLANPEETEGFRRVAEEARVAAEQRVTAQRMQIAVVGEAEMKALRAALRPRG